jgi:precorrin-6B C5,15-methyltransferase / cobalt-precorrin-6B C5,C15-methyltransferase
MIPVHIIGLGMSPEDLTPKALKVIEAAEVLAGGRRQLEYFASRGGERIVLGKDLAAAFQAIREAAARQRVVVLASGDPNYYGIGRRLTEFLGPDQVVVHPNITAVQSACALLKISWEDAVVVSLHGRGKEKLTEVLGRADKIMMYTAGAETPGEVAKLLQASGLPGYKMGVLEDLGAESQKVTWLSPAEAAEQTFSPLNMVVLLREAGQELDSLHLGLPEAALAHEAGLITKAEVRAVVLAKLQLRPGQILWDVGAGCGSVGLEASLLLPGGRVIAVEQQPERVRQIRTNKSRFGVHNLEVVEGSAPDCLIDLPRPDRVFIGGGGRRLARILEVVQSRLRPRGRIVVTATLLTTLHTASDILQSQGWAAEICQVQVSRSRNLGNSAYLQALNPVWIIAASPEETTS